MEFKEGGTLSCTIPIRSATPGLHLAKKLKFAIFDVLEFGKMSDGH